MWLLSFFTFLGISEYEAAAKLDPNDESIQKDLANLKEMMAKPKKQLMTH